MKRCAGLGRSFCVLFLLQIFGFYVFTNILFSLRPPGAPSFVARRKIEEKGVPRGCGPIGSPGVNVDTMPDVLCAYVFATVRLTRLSRLRRSAYPLASACCGAQKDKESYGTTRLPTTHHVGYSLNANDFAAEPRSTTESGGSSACNRAACCMKEAFAFGVALKS